VENLLDSAATDSIWSKRFVLKGGRIVHCFYSGVSFVYIGGFFCMDILAVFGVLELKELYILSLLNYFLPPALFHCAYDMGNGLDSDTDSNYLGIPM
jgi:hypothetical protein